MRRQGTTDLIIKREDPLTGEELSFDVEVNWFFESGFYGDGSPYEDFTVEAKTTDGLEVALTDLEMVKLKENLEANGEFI